MKKTERKWTLVKESDDREKDGHRRVMCKEGEENEKSMFRIAYQGTTQTTRLYIEIRVAHGIIHYNYERREKLMDFCAMHNLLHIILFNNSIESFCSAHLSICSTIAQFRVDP